MIYRVFKNNRPAGNLKFTTYEKARQYIRKRLRELTTTRNGNQPALPFNLLGYRIVSYKETV